MTDEVECPLTVLPCPHCSNEHESRPYMKLEKDPRTGLFKPGGLGKMEIDLGHYCNNVGCWCDELESCPVPVNLIEQVDMIEKYNEEKAAEVKKEERRKKRVVRKRVVGKKKRNTKVAKVKPAKKKVVKKLVKRNPVTKKVVKRPTVKKNNKGNNKKNATKRIK